MRKLLCPDTSTAPSLTLTDKSTCGGLIWESGSPIDTDDNDLSCLEFISERLPSGSMGDFALSDAGCVVVSERLKKALDEQGVNNIDYYPATVIERKRKAPRTGFYAANILGLVDVIDLEKSDYRGKERRGKIGITRIEKLVLKDVDEVHDNIYRIKMFRRLIVVEGRLCSLLQENRFSGIRLVEPERWDGFYGEIE